MENKISRLTVIKQKDQRTQKTTKKKKGSSTKTSNEEKKQQNTISSWPLKGRINKCGSYKIKGIDAGQDPQGWLNEMI